MDNLVDNILDKIEEQVDPYMEASTMKLAKYEALLQELPQLLRVAGYTLSDLDTIETSKHYFGNWKQFFDNQDYDVFGYDIIITMKDHSFFKLMYLERIDMYASIYFPKQKEESSDGHYVFASSFGLYN